MKNIALLIPTLDRPKELNRLSTSIEKAMTWLAVDELVQVFISREVAPRPLPVIVNELVANAMEIESLDGVVILADHLVLGCLCLREVFTFFGDNIDTDIMGGLNIANLPFNPNISEFCFPVIGRKFIERFPEYQVFCPEYHHFCADTELGIFAKRIGKFKFLRDARVETYHPNVGNAPKDNTYWASRKNSQEDQRIFTARKTAGFLWGDNFERIGES